MHACVCKYICMNVCIYVCMHVDIYVCMCVCMYMYVSGLVLSHCGKTSSQF